MKTVSERGAAAAGKAFVNARDASSKHFDEFMKDPVKVTTNIILGIGKAENTFVNGMYRLVTDTKNLSQEANDFLENLCEKWDSLTPDEKLEGALEVAFGIPFSAASPFGVVAGTGNIKTTLQAVKNLVKASDKATKTYVKANKALDNAFKKSGKNPPSLGKALSDGMGRVVERRGKAARKVVGKIGKPIKIFEKNAKHIFRNKEGHFRVDTAENRKLLIDMVNNKKNYLGPIKWEKQCYAKMTKNGKQIWAEVRNGEIRNAGINDIPRTFNPETGLCRPFKPKKVKPHE